MSVDIKLKHSAVAGKKPDPGQLQNGELALNTKDVKAYIKDSDGNVVQIAGKDMPDNDSRYVQVTGDDMTGDLTLGTDKITLGASDGSASFAGTIDVGVPLTSDGGIKLNQLGEVLIYRDISDGPTAAAASVFTGVNEGNVTSTIKANGSASFAGDVAIGDSNTFFGTIGDAVALLPNSIVDQFKTVIDGLPKAQPYGATTLPADLPTPLKDALVRVTTAGKINLNSDGSASFAGGNTEIKSGGNIAVYRPETSPTSVLQQWLSDNGTVKSNQIEFFANGSASFAGNVTATSNNIFGGGNLILRNPDRLQGNLGSIRMNDKDGNTRANIGFTAASESGGANLYYYLDDLTDVGNTGKATMSMTSDAFNIGGVVNPNIAGNPNIKLSTDGSATFESSLTSKYAGKGVVQTAASAAHGVMVKDVDGNINGTIGWDGSATFTGGIDVANRSTFANGVVVIANDGGVNVKNISQSDSNWTIQTDGSASFASTSILLGNPNGYIYSSRTYEGNASNVVLEINTDSSEGNCFLKGTTGNGATTRFFVDRDGSATFAGNVTAPNVLFNLEPDNDANYTTTTEEYTETEYYTVEVPVVERPGTGTADIQDGVSTADLVDGDERQTQTITKSREVTKTREVKTYTGPVMDVKEKLLAYEERFKQQDAVIAQMTTLLKGLGADVSTLPALEGVTKKKKR